MTNDIALPVDTTPYRLREPGVPPILSDPAQVDDVAETLAKFRRLALSTGAEVRVDPVEYAAPGAEGPTWVDFWMSETTFPIGARVTVYRDGVPTTISRRWVEALPGPESLTDKGRRWQDIWLENPTERLESYVIRAALAAAFPDVIGRDLAAPRASRPIAPPAEVIAEPARVPVSAEVEHLADAFLQTQGIGPAEGAPKPGPPARGVPTLAAPIRRGGAS